MKHNWYDKVKHILSVHPEARDDDFILYLDIVRTYTDAPVWAMSFEEAMTNRATYGMPSYEAITRARRRVQHDIADLRGQRYDSRQAEQATFMDEFARDYK